jgi:DNA-binding transcriptional LysR family regulator
MLDLNDLYLFVQVVDKRGFAAAGRALDLPKSSLSRRIGELETRLGVRLIHRTSRSFVVTEIGHELYRHALAMLVEAEAAEAAVKRRLAEPSGAVRFTCSVSLAQYVLAELLPRFLSAYPKVELVQHATNRTVELVDEGFDFALRAHGGPLADSSLVRRPLASVSWHLVASPAYLERAGTPRAPEDLPGHAGLLLDSRAGDAHWTLKHAGGETTEIAFRPSLRSDDMVTLTTAARRGLGIVALPCYLVAADLAAGRLRRVLPDWTAGDATLTVLAPSRRYQLPAVRAFIDFLAAELPPALAA